MPKMIFVNLPVADVARATAFYEAVGATKDDRFSEGEAGAMLSFSDAIHFMLLSHARFADFTPKSIVDPTTHVQILLNLSEDSREAVDATVARAVAAGGTADPSPVEDYGWMYGRSFDDPDGHGVGVSWMDVAAAMAATQTSTDGVSA